MQRESGVLLPVSALYGDYGIGGFSDAATCFIDFLVSCGFSCWQVLPFGVTDAYNSPYQSYSAFAGNPYFIDLEKLYEEGLLTKTELLSQKQNSPYDCQYEVLSKTRLSILAAAAHRVKNWAEIEAYIEKEPHLESFCRFMARKAANAQKAWTMWETDKEDPETLFTWKFIQFMFFRQWGEIKRYAEKRHIKIIGDIPFYVAHDSADVWANPSLFELDTDGNPLAVAGVPPDYFSLDGQMWGNPLYNWESMEKDNFGWWEARIQKMLSLFDMVRIDHFRAIDSYWRIPYSAKTAREGVWERGPGKKLIDVIRAAQKGKTVIAEDLGDLSESVHTLRAYSTFPGMRVLQFGFMGEGDSIHKPHHYPKNTVCYTGTHDNNTLLGYLWELPLERRNELLSYCGYHGGGEKEELAAIMRTMFQSHADLLILPIQDLLGYGRDTRINIPGRAEGNWRFRITKAQLDSIDREKYQTLNKLYCR